jgi:hypothetical protein
MTNIETETLILETTAFLIKQIQYDSDYDSDDSYTSEDIEYNNLSDEDKILVTNEITSRLDDFIEEFPHELKITCPKHKRDYFRYLMCSGSILSTVCENKIIFKINRNKNDKNMTDENIFYGFDTELSCGYFNHDGDQGVQLSIGYIETIFCNTTQ